MSLFKQCCRELLISKEQTACTKRHGKTGRPLVWASHYDFSHCGQYNTDDRPAVILALKHLSVSMCERVCLHLLLGSIM